MTPRIDRPRMRLLVAFLTTAPLMLCEMPRVWKSEEIGAKAANVRGARPLHSGAGYSIQLQSLEKEHRSAWGESVDQILWIRGGSGRLVLGLPARQAEISAGDLVRLPRGTPYSIEPLRGKFEFVAVKIMPLAAGRTAPAGIRPAGGEMGDVVKKAEISATIARTPANAPLHSQDNFTVNYVLFKGRTGPWEAHAGCADIYFVQTGTGAIQLGGSIENAKEETAGEPRGTGMTGSQESAVGAGDLVVIPRNVAHHMNPKTMPLAYVLVKVWAD